MMRKLFNLLIYFMALSTSAFAQFPNPVLFNTATNASGTGTLSINTQDLNWMVSMTGPLGPYVPAVSADNPYPSNWVSSPFPNANWISYPHTCPPVTGYLTSPAEHSCLNPSNMDMYYRLVFNLPATNCSQAISTASAYCLSLDFYADNTVANIEVNGAVQYQGNSNYYDLDYQANNGKTVSLCNNWIAGSNTLIVHIKSGSGFAPTWEALLAQVNQTVNPSIGVPIYMSTSVINATACTGANGSATVTASGAAGPYSYSWQPAGGTSSVAANLAPGIYTVTIWNASGCTNTKTVSISKPSLTITTNLLPPNCSGEKVVLTASGATSYTWQPGNLSGATVTVSPASTTVYTVTGTNSAGCTGTKSYTQSVLICADIRATENRALSFEVVPNPSSGLFHLTNITAGDFVEIFDLTGRVVREVRSEDTTVSLDLSAFNSGLYFIKVSRGEYESIRKVLITKEK